MLDFNEFNLYLIRHGQSVVNIIPDQMGQDPDTPLTPHGRKQAELLGARLSEEVGQFLYTYSSDYTRALDTANIATEPYNHNIKVCPALREYSAGDWAGSVRSQVATTQVRLRMGYMNNAFLPPGGESMNQVERRASEWMEETILYNPEIQEIARSLREKKQPKMNLGVFSHGMTIKCLLHHIMGFDKSFTWKLTLDNTGICHLVFNEEGWRLISINDRAHLM